MAVSYAYWFIPRINSAQEWHLIRRPDAAQFPPRTLAGIRQFLDNGGTNLEEVPLSASHVLKLLPIADTKL
jgi:hypothetical protein